MPIQKLVTELEDAEETGNLQLQPMLPALASLGSTAQCEHPRPKCALLNGIGECPTRLRRVKTSVLEVAQLHLLNRVLGTFDPSIITTFAYEWA